MKGRKEKGNAESAKAGVRNQGQPPPKLIELFEGALGQKALAVAPLGAHASDRKKFRIQGATSTAIGVFNQNPAENAAFVEFARHFKKFGVPVPEILAEDLSQDIYLEEDLGDLTLLGSLQSLRSESDPFPRKVELLYRQALKILPRLQIDAGKTLDYKFCFPAQRFDQSGMESDFKYFAEHFLKFSKMTVDLKRLNAECARLFEYLGEAPAETFMHRDFQARNIMVKGEKIYFIDFQGGRRGALQYDLVSLVYQSSARIPNDRRQELISWYFECLSDHGTFDRHSFMRYLPGFLLIRILQNLGAYGKLGLKEGKEYFRESIADALVNLKELFSCNTLEIELPYLKGLALELRP